MIPLEKATCAFIGGGNMASAILHGLLRVGCLPKQLRVGEPSATQRQKLTEQFNITVTADNCAVVRGADAVILAVKPPHVAPVAAEIAPHLGPETVVISLAAGIELATIRAPLPISQPVVRVMPNTPALIGEGIAALYPAPDLNPDHLALTKSILGAVGHVVIVDKEALMDGVTALSGSGPAYVYLIAEALSDGGVACGLPRPLADALTIQTLIGAARLLQERGVHPGELKNQVTSPGGTTIAGLAALEKAGARSAFIEAVQAAWHRSRALHKQ